MLESAVGVDLGGTKALFVAGPHAMRFDTGPSFTPADFAAMLDRSSRARGCRPSHVGIAVPGLVDASGRVVACDVLPALAGWRPAAALGALGCPVAVVNDVRGRAPRRAARCACGLTAGVVMVGTAIGAAFLAHGAPLRGTSGWAGELGYFRARRARRSAPGRGRRRRGDGGPARRRARASSPSSRSPASRNRSP
jgi:predicted NBD/HSP70 family sugar kinase